LHWVCDDEAYTPVQFEEIMSTLNVEKKLIPWITPPSRRFRFQNQQQINRPQEEEGIIGAPPFIRSSTTTYQTIFFGLCYACNNFGHKYVNCRDNNRNNNYLESHTQRGYSRRPSETQRISYNRFESLRTEVECYKCNNFGHDQKFQNDSPS
jgi:hypothetical protein